MKFKLTTHALMLFISITFSTVIFAQEPLINADGGIKIGSTIDTLNGIIRYHNNSFEGFTNGSWRSLVGPENIWSKNANNIYYNGGNIGIGTSNPGLIGGASKYLTIDHGGAYTPFSSTSLELKGNVNAANAMTSRVDFINGLTPTVLSRISTMTNGATVLQGHLAFSTNDGALKERMRITDNGYVGIGLQNPTSILTISDTNRNALTLYTSNNNLNNGIAFQNSGLGYTWNIFRSNGGSSQANLVFAGGVTNPELTGLPQRLILHKHGNVGVGALIPRAKLHIENNVSETVTANQVRLHDGGSSNSSVYGLGISGFDFDMFSGSNYRFHTSSTHSSRGNEVLTILENGNIGVGNDAPEKLLHVQGGALRVSNSGNSTGHVELSAPDVDPGIVFYSNSPENFRADIRRNINGLFFDVGESSNPVTKLTILNNSNIGIGTTNPLDKLHVIGVARAGNSASEYVQIGHGGSHAYVNAVGDGNIDFRHDGDTKMSLLPSGALSIGDVTTPAGYNLYVENGILTEEVKVAIKNTADWADDAFEKTPSVLEVESNINEKSHLLEMPSAQELVDKGYSVTDMDAKLLQQIEWLWMHTIEMKKENIELKADIRSLKNELKVLKEIHE